MAKENGFTLMELLVVISIIALLISILVPALGIAREQGRSLVCQTHMSQLVVAWTSYAIDNDDCLCGAFNYNNNYANWGHPWDWSWAPWRLDIDMGVPFGGIYTDEQRKEGIRKGALYKYTNTVDLYHCPSDKTGNFRSYSMPDCLNGMEKEWHPANPRWNVITRLSQVKRPGEKYAFLEENDPRGFNMDSWEKSEDGITWNDPLTVWHSRASNMGFADGHSERVKWSEETTDYFLVYNNTPFTPRTDKGIEDLKYMLKGWAQ